jgi:hypothetical protein
LEKLQRLEEKRKISMQLTGSLNPIYIQIIDPKVESEVAKNPLIESIDQ